PQNGAHGSDPYSADIGSEKETAHGCKKCGALCVIEYSKYECDQGYCQETAIKPLEWYRLSLGMSKFDGTDWPYGIIRNLFFCRPAHMQFYLDNLKHDVNLIPSIDHQSELDALKKKVQLLEAKIEIKKRNPPIIIETIRTNSDETVKKDLTK